MNRRQFTASLAALAAVPALPFQALAARAAPVAVPPGAYAWAQLIARAQNGCSPAMLAQQLNLSGAAANQLFRDMVADGVLRAPGAAGVARAVNPIDIPGAPRSISTRIADKTRDTLKRMAEQADKPPLVKDTPTCLECADTAPEENAHASPDQSVQESPERG